MGNNLNQSTWDITMSSKSPRGRSSGKAAAKKPAKTSYLEMIQVAILTLDDRGGSSRPALWKCVEAKYPAEADKKRFLLALKRLSSDGSAVQHGKNKQRFTLEKSFKARAMARMKQGHPLKTVLSPKAMTDLVKKKMKAKKKPKAKKPKKPKTGAKGKKAAGKTGKQKQKQKAKDNKKTKGNAKSKAKVDAKKAKGDKKVAAKTKANTNKAKKDQKAAKKPAADKGKSGAASKAKKSARSSSAGKARKSDAVAKNRKSKDIRKSNKSMAK